MHVEVFIGFRSQFGLSIMPPTMTVDKVLSFFFFLSTNGKNKMLALFVIHGCYKMQKQVIAVSFFFNNTFI